jgi:hypothetical protein
LIDRKLFVSWIRATWFGWLLGIPIIIVFALIGKAVHVGGSSCWRRNGNWYRANARPGHTKLTSQNSYVDLFMYSWTRRAERLGAGRTIMRKHYSAERAAIELKELFANPSYREIAGALGRTIQAENGVRVACDAIEEQLNQLEFSAPSLRPLQSPR